MDVEVLRRGFTYLLFERVNREKNEARFYYLAWQPTLFEQGAVVRIFGRRLRNGYLLMKPVSQRSGSTLLRQEEPCS